MKKYICLFLICFIQYSCSKSSDNSSSVTPTDTGAGVPEVFKAIYGASSITLSGDYVIIKTNGLPDHKSVYYPSTNSLYENFSGKTVLDYTFNKNPNSIASQSLTFKIPVKPQKATNSTATPLGSIGVSLNGVPFFNQYAGPNQPLTNEITSFDQWWGHPQQSGQYHYHLEPKYLTTVKATKSSLLGFLLDGFPVYGPTENGKTVTNADLDVLHGHSHVTTEYPSGIYHYHITSNDPFINGNGFYGTPGTVSN